MGTLRGESETLRGFADSFAYGSRTDLAFKFLENLSEEEVAGFFQALLKKLGETMDDADATRLIDLAYDWQVRGYRPLSDGADRWSYPEGPFTAPAQSVAVGRLALVTASGHFVVGDDPRPFGVDGMTQEEATRRIDDFLREAPQLSVIPKETPGAALLVRHGGYDVRAARSDPGVVFPLDVLRELERQGRIGVLAPEAYSFVGATSQLRLLRHSAPAWVDRIQQSKVDFALLVPA